MMLLESVVLGVMVAGVVVAEVVVTEVVVTEVVVSEVDSLEAVTEPANWDMLETERAVAEDSCNYHHAS